MADRRISHNIVEICHRLGIKFESKNPNYNKFYEDALRMRDIYNKLKIIAGDLEEICEKHTINGLNGLLKDDINLIEKIEHDLVKMAKAINKENE